MPRTLVPEWEMRDRLRKALDVSGVGVSEMADELGVSRNAVGNWLAGRTKPSRSWCTRRRSSSSGCARP